MSLSVLVDMAMALNSLFHVTADILLHFYRYQYGHELPCNTLLALLHFDVISQCESFYTPPSIYCSMSVAHILGVFSSEYQGSPLVFFVTGCSQALRDESP